MGLPKIKVDLSLIKKFISELEESLNVAEAIRETSSNDYIVEMSKSYGLASGAAAEATALMGDIQAMVKAQGILAVQALMQPLIDAENAEVKPPKGSKGGGGVN